MAGIYMLIAIGEAVITTLVVAAVARARPELLASRAPTFAPSHYVELTAYGLLVSLGLVVFVAPFASGWPDGLEKVAAALGFEHKATATPIMAAPLSNYTIPGFQSAVSSTIVAGGVGILVAFVLAYVLARALTPRGDAAHGRDAGGASPCA
jgi:cobalt/nickel transport system permease protein